MKNKIKKMPAPLISFLVTILIAIITLTSIWAAHEFKWFPEMFFGTLGLLIVWWMIHATIYGENI